MVDFPDGVFGSCPAVALVAWLLALGVTAVLAFLDRRAAEVVWVLSEVVLATLFGNAVGLSEGVDAAGVTAVAAASSFTVDDDLW